MGASKSLFRKATGLFVLLTLSVVVAMNTDGSLTGESKSPSRSRSHSPFHSNHHCRPCSSPHSANHQCQLPAQCHRGHCSVDLNRCSAEWFNAKFGANIDLSYWDEEEQKEIAIEAELKQLQQKYAALTDQQDQHTGQLNEAEYEPMLADSTFENEIEEKAEISSSAGIHVHIGCGKCKNKVYCERLSDCNKWHPNAYCFKQPKNALAGWCKLQVPTVRNGIYHIDEFCCEYD